MGELIPDFRRLLVFAMFAEICAWAANRERVLQLCAALKRSRRDFFENDVFEYFRDLDPTDEELTVVFLRSAYEARRLYDDSSPAFRHFLGVHGLHSTRGRWGERVTAVLEQIEASTKIDVELWPKEVRPSETLRGSNQREVVHAYC